MTAAARDAAPRPGDGRPPSPPVFDSAFVEDTLGDLLRDRGGGDARFHRAVIDSRRVEPGDFFVALPGERTDGHDHAAAAAARGAAGLLLERPAAGLEEQRAGADREGPAYFLVPNALAALQVLGARWRAALPATEVIGITGNVGKTTTKAIAAALLRTRYRVAASPLNYNNEIGVPLCLLELTPDIERAVIEHGMYTTGEIALLCHWTRPRIGCVLNVGPVHLERAGSMETIARAKRELVEALPPDGWAILNADDAVVAAMAGHTRARVLRFGTAAAAEVRGARVEPRGEAGFAFDLHAPADLDPVSGRWTRTDVRRVHCPLPGRHLLSNVLAAAAVALVDGVGLDDVCAAIERLDVPLRLAIRELRLAGGAITLLDDTYNASPQATRAALDLLAEIAPGPGGRRVALLGDMRELGARSTELHADTGRYAAERVDLLLTVGDEAQVLSDAARAAGLAPGAVRHLSDPDAAAAALAAALHPGDVVLVKGSRALALERVIASLETRGAEDGR